MTDDNQANRAYQYRRRAQAEQSQPPKTSNLSEDAEAAGTPDAVKESESRRAAREKLARVRGRGVDWVRPTDLIAQGGGAVSRRGIDITAAGNRRLRVPIERGARWAAERVRRLPPLSAFGRRGHTDQGQVRSGVGMR